MRVLRQGKTGVSRCRRHAQRRGVMSAKARLITSTVVSAVGTFMLVPALIDPLEGGLPLLAAAILLVAARLVSRVRAGPRDPATTRSSIGTGGVTSRADCRRIVEQKGPRQRPSPRRHDARDSGVRDALGEHGARRP